MTNIGVDNIGTGTVDATENWWGCPDGPGKENVLLSAEQFLHSLAETPDPEVNALGHDEKETKETTDVTRPSDRLLTVQLDPFSAGRTAMPCSETSSRRVNSCLYFLTTGIAPQYIVSKA